MTKQAKLIAALFLAISPLTSLAHDSESLNPVKAVDDANKKGLELIKSSKTGSPYANQLTYFYKKIIKAKNDDVIEKNCKKFFSTHGIAETQDEISLIEALDEACKRYES